MTIARNLTALSAGAALALASGLALADASAAPAQPGTWQKHEYSFAFMGFTSTYSCDGLADKLRDLLIAAGARADAKARPGACARGFGRPDKFARASLTFYTLSPAASSDGGGDASQSTTGTWRSVALADHKPSTLRVGDCELVEQFSHSVLPMFTTQNVVNRTTCVPHQDSGSVIDLRFDAFTTAPAVAGAKS